MSIDWAFSSFRACKRCGQKSAAIARRCTAFSPRLHWQHAHHGACPRTPTALLRLPADTALAIRCQVNTFVLLLCSTPFRLLQHSVHCCRKAADCAALRCRYCCSNVGCVKGSPPQHHGTALNRCMDPQTNQREVASTKPMTGANRAAADGAIHDEATNARRLRHKVDTSHSVRRSLTAARCARPGPLTCRSTAPRDR